MSEDGQCHGVHKNFHVFFMSLLRVQDLFISICVLTDLPSGLIQTASILDIPFYICLYVCQINIQEVYCP